MSASIFGPEYARHYDALYRAKDYELECDLIEGALSRYGERPASSVLDLGCGTGNHMECLARRGYQVTGVDRSEHMLARAREKAASHFSGADDRPAFLAGDCRAAALGRQFDAVLMMFGVLSYQLTDEDVRASLRTVRAHLPARGLFIFDVWFGPAVLAIRPGNRFQAWDDAAGRVERLASGTVDEDLNACNISITLRQIDTRGTTETVEAHHVRYFFTKELDALLSEAGLHLLSLTAFPTLDVPSDQGTWNVFGVARAN